MKKHMNNNPTTIQQTCSALFSSLVHDYLEQGTERSSVSGRGAEEEDWSVSDSVIVSGSGSEEPALRRWRRYLFPLRERLLFYVRTPMQLTFLQPLFARLNRSFLLLCEFDVEQSGVTLPDTVHYIEFCPIEGRRFLHPRLAERLPALHAYCDSVTSLVSVLCPTGLVTVGRPSYKEKVWRLMAEADGVHSLALDNDSAPDAGEKAAETVLRLNDVFPYQQVRSHAYTCLHLGCGTFPIREWMNTDVREKGGIYLLDVSRPFPFADNVFERIFSEHLLDCLSLPDALNMLSECWRVLQPGGRIRISTLDLDFPMRLWREPDEPSHKRYVEWVAGMKKSEAALLNRLWPEKDYPPMLAVNHFMRHWGRQMVYDRNTVRHLLERSGFRQVEYYAPGQSDDARLCRLEQHGKAVPLWVNRLETMTMEAIKPIK